MNIQVAVLCDAATDDNGKLNLLGAFDTIYTQQLPAVHPQCSIALRVTFSSEDEGKHNLQLNFVDADGRSIAQVPAHPRGSGAAGRHALRHAQFHREPAANEVR